MLKTLPRSAAILTFLGAMSGVQAQDATSKEPEQILKNTGYYVSDPNITMNILTAAFRVALAQSPDKQLNIGTVIQWPSLKMRAFSPMTLVHMETAPHAEHSTAPSEGSPCYVFKLVGQDILQESYMDIDPATGKAVVEKIMQPDQQPYAKLCVDSKNIMPAASENVLHNFIPDANLIADYMKAFPAGSPIPVIKFNFVQAPQLAARMQ
jgi:hypothetical protein